MRRKFIIREIRKNFECQRCNLCCKVPGFVFLTSKDITRISNHLNLAENDFLNEYCEKEDDDYVLMNHEDGACVFLDEKTGCRIHDVKPKQCVVFPHKWRDPDAYDYCEGILKIKNSST